MSQGQRGLRRMFRELLSGVKGDYAEFGERLRKEGLDANAALGSIMVDELDDLRAEIGNRLDGLDLRFKQIDDRLERIDWALKVLMEENGD